MNFTVKWRFFADDAETELNNNNADRDNNVSGHDSGFPFHDGQTHLLTGMTS